MKATIFRLAAFACLLVIVLLVDAHWRDVEGQGSTSLWSKQFGTSSDDEARAVITDNQANIYVVGDTQGSLFGNNAGDGDGFIVKYDPNGSVLWSHQFGTIQGDYPETATLDSQNNLYVVGETSGSLFNTNAGPAAGPDADSGTLDTFIVKYAPDGRQLWAKQFGAQGNDCAYGVATDSNNSVYLVGFTDGSVFGTNAGADASGQTSDAFVVKYDADGNQLWGKQFGVSGDDVANDVCVDQQGNSYVAGYTWGSLFNNNLGDTDAFVVKFDPSGNQLWGKQFGTSLGDVAGSICLDGSGNIYLTGTKNSGETPDTDDGFLNKLDQSGNLLWSIDLATPSEDTACSVAVDGQGNALVGGTTKGSLFGPNVGDEDIFLAQYDPAGNRLWSHQYGTSGADGLNGVFLGGDGNIYIAGYTYGDLPGPNSGGRDAFVQKLSPTGQMAMIPNRHRPLHQPLQFAWSGVATNLLYPPFLINGRPYLYVGYLCSGVPGAEVSYTKTKQIVIDNQRGRRIVLSSRGFDYSLNGKARKMAAKPVLVEGHCYVPLDVMQAVLPFPVSYQAKTRTVRFDPPRLKQARK